MLLLDAVRAGFSATLRSKRFIAINALTTLLIALPPAVVFGREVHAAAAHRPDATAIARTLDPDFFFELRAANPGFEATMTALVAVSIGLYLLLRPFVWAGYCGIAAHKRKLPVSVWLRESGAGYWKFLRIAVIGGVVLFAVTLAEKPLLDLVEGWAKDDQDEGTAERYRFAGHVAALAGLQIVKLILDYAKVGVRLHRRPGVFAELARSAMFVMQHLRPLLVFVVSRALEAAAILAVMLVLPLADGAYVTTTVVVVILGTVLVALREAVTLFHLAAAWHVRALEDAPPPPAPSGTDEPDLLQAQLPWNEE